MNWNREDTGIKKQKHRTERNGKVQNDSFQCYSHSFQCHSVLFQYILMFLQFILVFSNTPENNFKSGI